MFNIQQLLQQAFGIQPQVLLAIPESVPTLPGSFTVQTMSYTNEYDTTLAGTPWIDAMNMARSVDWKDQVFGGMQLPPTTMVDATRKRTIVETAIAGRDGTVKELISAQDWQLHFRGLLINEKSLDPPHAAIHEMKEMSLFQGAISVEGGIFRALGIDAIVVTDLAIRPISGTPNAVAFEFSATSDNTDEFAIITKQ